MAIGSWVLLSSILASSMAFIDGSALNVALPQIQKTLKATATDLLWINNAYLLMLAALLLVGGSLGDRFGRKRIFGYGIWLFSLASVICGLAPTVSLLIAARIVQGLGAALMIPGSLAIISAYFDDRSRGEAIGTWSALTAATTIGGPILGGFLADTELWAHIFSLELASHLWRGIFFINVPLAAVALYALYAHVPESRDSRMESVQIDIVGAFLITTGLGALNYGLIQAGGIGFSLENTIALSLGLVLVGLFIAWEFRCEYHKGNSDAGGPIVPRTQPMVSMRLYRSPVFSGTNLMTCFLYGALYGAFFFFSLNLIQIQNYPASIAGFAGTPFALMLLFLSRRAGRLADRIGARTLLVSGSVLNALGFGLLALPDITQGPSQYWSSYFPGMLAMGLGMGLSIAPLTAALMGSIPVENSGIASGINNAIARTAGVISISIFGVIMLLQFRLSLDAHAVNAGVSLEERQTLLARANELGNLKLSSSGEGVPKETQIASRQAVRLAFVDAYRLVMGIAAVFSVISALCAFFLLGMSPEESRRRLRA